MRLAWWMGALVAIGAVGCGPKVPYEDTDIGVDSEDAGTVGSSTATTTSSPTTVGTTSSTSTPPTATSPSTSPPPPPPTASGSVSVTTAFPTDTNTTTTTGGGGNNGQPCMDNSECDSGMCFVVGVLGGICGECLTDADCPDGGCSPPNPLQGMGAVCNEGMFGDGCETDASCSDGLVCSEIIDVPGVISQSTCSECRNDDGCAGSLLCSPVYEIQDFTGARLCVAPGSVPNGEGCNHSSSGSGDQACASGHCAIASVMGLFNLGVCSECESNLDCPMGTVCNPPEVDLTFGLLSGYCG